MNGFDDSREADVGVDLVSQLSRQAKEWRVELVSKSAWSGISECKLMKDDALTCPFWYCSLGKA